MRRVRAGELADGEDIVRGVEVAGPRADRRGVELTPVGPVPHLLLREGPLNGVVRVAVVHLVVARAVVVEVRALEPLSMNISYIGRRRHDLRGMCGREPRKARGLAAVLRNLEREGEHQQPL